tara:strand:- start:7531 stop:9243 length:1713 start_codon:yes stop_codon:yes gene_type:complete
MPSDPKAASQPSDEQLWSWVDRAAPELDAHLQAHPSDRERVDQLRGAIGALQPLGAELPMPEMIGSFRVRGVLGRGAMGTVYDAEQTEPKRSVALKVLPREWVGDERRLQLFRREADALARLSHPGIATIFEVGRDDDGHPFLAMERVQGVTLREYLEAHRLNSTKRVRLALAIAKAVGHAHDQGVVHRDLKPANILVDDQGAPHVVDFGLARIQGDGENWVTQASQDSSLAGTLPYMSPEQVRGRLDALGPSSDVYGLGVLLFEMLTGRFPYDMKDVSLPEAARRICEAPPRFGWKGPRGSLRTILAHALEKDPNRRYANANELALDLQRHLDGRPIQARKITWTRSGLRFVRRRWALCSISFVLMLFSVALLWSLPGRLPLGGWWISRGSPFEEIHWVGDEPIVEIGGESYWLLEIDGYKAGYLVGHCQQYADSLWRKRFSEDLVQVLHRLGDWAILDVDLLVRDVDTGKTRLMEDVPLSKGLRRRIVNGRKAQPWDQLVGFNPHRIVLDESTWDLLSVDGVDAERLNLTRFFDSYCDVVGRSPGTTVELELQREDERVIRVVRWRDQ